MPTWIRNIPETWANTRGWRTDIALTNLHHGYDTAEYLLEDGTRIRISMTEMRRALVDANVRQNLMVGPFDVDPFGSHVNGVSVSMEVIHSSH